MKSFISMYFGVIAIALSFAAVSPLDFHPKIWLDASDSQSIVENGLSVSQWKDKSGFLNHFTPVAIENQPTWDSVHNTMEFDGIDDYLVGPDLDFSTDSSLTVIILTEVDSTLHTEDKTPIIKGQYSVSPLRITLSNKVIKIVSGDQGYYNYSIAPIGSPQIFGVKYETGKVHSYIQGEKWEEKSSNFSTNNNPITIGAKVNGSSPLQGRIYEVLVFDQALSDCDIQYLEGYLAHKWGMQSSLGLSHPFRDFQEALCTETVIQLETGLNNGASIQTVEGMSLGDVSKFSNWAIEDEGIVSGVFDLNEVTGEIRLMDSSALYGNDLPSQTLIVSAIVDTIKVFGKLVINVPQDTNSQSTRQYSRLWGQKGELWDPRGRLPDFGYSGLTEEKSKLGPSESLVYSVLDYGAIANDTIDDSQAINLAIQSIDSGIIEIPEGLFILDNPVVIDKNKIILRGAGTDKTTLHSFKSASDRYGYDKGFSTGGSGFILSIQGANAGPKTDILSNTQRGDQTIEVSDASKFSPGDFITIHFSGATEVNPINGKLWNHLMNNQNTTWPCSVGWAEAGDGLTLAHRVLRVEGNLITLQEPLELDINPEWLPVIQNRSNHYVSGSAVEDIHISFDSVVQPGHLTEQGYNGIELSRTVNSWAKNVKVSNSDNGIAFHASIYSSLEGATLEGRGGHHGISFDYTARSLADSLVYLNDSTWIHSFTYTHKSNMNVISNIWGDEVISIDYHRNPPFANLTTEVHSEWNHNSSGTYCAGPHAGARTVYWNMFGDAETPSWNNYQTTIVSKLGVPESFDTERGWSENISNVSPQNLHLAQIKRLDTLTIDSVLTISSEIGHRGDWWERDPSRWQSGDEKYRLSFGKYSTIGGERLGEYSVLQTDTVTTLNVYVKVQENRIANPATALSMLYNYQDDQNYSHVDIGLESSFYHVQNGVSTPRQAINFELKEGHYSLRKVAGGHSLYFECQEVSSISDTLVNSGRLGLGGRTGKFEFSKITNSEEFPIYTSTKEILLDEGNTTFINGENVGVAGIYFDTLQSSGGCDSIVTVDLKVDQTTSSIVNQGGGQSPISVEFERDINLITVSYPDHKGYTANLYSHDGYLIHRFHSKTMKTNRLPRGRYLVIVGNEYERRSHAFIKK